MNKQELLENATNEKFEIEIKDFSKDFQNSYFNNRKQFNNKKDFIEIVDLEDFKKEYLNKDSTHNIFEVIQKETKLKPFYDIDKGFETEQEFNSKHQDLLTDVMNKLGVMYPLGNLAISKAHGWKMKNQTINGETTEKKHYAMSFHIVVNNYETTIQELRKYNEEHDIYNKFDFVDKGVYRTYGLMKCLYGSKPWEHRYKTIETNTNPLAHLIQSNKKTNTGFNKLNLNLNFLEKSLIKNDKKNDNKNDEEKPTAKKNIKIKKEDNKKSECFSEKHTLNKNNNSQLVFSDVIQTLLSIRTKWLYYKDIIDVGMAFFNTCKEIDELESGKIIIAQWIKNGTKIWTSRPDRSVADWNTRIIYEWEYWTKRNNEVDNKLTYGSLVRWSKETKIAESKPPEKYNELSELNKEYLKLIPCNNNTWYKVGAILKRLKCNQKIWDEWTVEYTQEDNNFRWLDIEKYNYNEKTLYFLASEYNKEKASHLKNSLYEKVVSQYMKNQTEYQMARLIKEYIKNIYCIESEGRNKAFIIPNEYNRWEKKNKAQLGKILSEEVYYIFINKSAEAQRQKKATEKKIKELQDALTMISINDSESKESNLKKIQDKINEETNILIELTSQISIANTTAKKLQTQSSKNNFISALIDSSYEEGIEDKLDEANPYLINFNNGAYDLKNGCFIIPEPDDFVSKTTGFDYVAEIDEEIRKELFYLLNKIYKDETDETTELRDYNMKIIASSLCGVNKYEGFYVWTGAGGNGKGLLDSLCGMVFGEYYDVIDKSFFTTQKKSSGSADPELAGKKGIRMLVSSECEKTEEFQANKLKLLSGNDNISTRGLFKEQFKFIPQFTIFIQSNGSPNLSQVDKGVKRRFRLIEHPTQFVKNPDPSNRYEERKDVSLKEKFRNDIRYRQQFMLILIEYYNEHIKNDKAGEITTPKMVRDYTDDFIYDNDVIGQFLFENKLKITNNKSDVILQRALWDIYKQSNYSDDVVRYSRNEFYKLISNYEGIKKVRRSDGLYFQGIKLYLE